ncbi:TolC family protein [Rhodohalobacter sp. 8-1]|uniref:TolC family protein n=1 Tax=Rhodohalobacter sp. 8-1 TaxID=3131972 RepID=UPI0030EDB350
MNKLLFLTAILFIVLAGSVSAQDRLSLEDAIGIGLENNYNIQIFENRLSIAENNRSFGNAGFLPALNLSASRTESVEDSEFNAGGQSQTTNGARSTTTNAAVTLDWTLFDGLGMFKTYDLLGVLEEISDAEYRLEVENLVSRITLSYFDIVRIENQLRVLENTVDVSLERIEIEETKLDLGSGSEVELLQARSDLNADRSALLREGIILTEAKIVLNQLLARDPDTAYSVTGEIPIQRGLDEQYLYEKTITENTELDLVRMQQNAADLEVQQIRSERYPEILLNSGYRYNRNEAGGGFFQFNETTGFSVGLTARVNLFDGFNINRRVENARINRKNSDLQLDESRLLIRSRFRTLFRTYQNNIELVDLEQDNLSNAEETLDIALERFRLGGISSLELREAQRSFLEAENRLINSQFNAKVAETELLRLSGEL